MESDPTFGKTRNPNSFLASAAAMKTADKLLSKSSKSRMNNKNAMSPGIESEFPNKKKIRAKIKETGTDSMKNYMKNMCDHELLNKNEEIILAREIQILLKWEATREELEQQLLR